MAKGFVRIGKIAMATIGSSWILLNLEALYKQTKSFLMMIPLYILFFNLIIVCIIFSSTSTSTSNSNYLLAKLQSITGNSLLNPTSQGQPLLKHQLSRSFSDIWYRIMDQESNKGDNADGIRIIEPTPIEEADEPQATPILTSRRPLGKIDAPTDHEPLPNVNLKEEDELVIEEEEDVLYEEEDGKDSLEDAWKSIMEGKQKELKKSNTWHVTPTIEQMKAEKQPYELESTKSLRVEEKNGGGGIWGWRNMEVVLSRDELNHNVEEFITKIKRNIRLERLESYNLFLQLINRRTD